MSDVLDTSSVVRALGLALVYFVWQGAVIWTIVAVALRLTRRASTRYVVASLGLFALAAAPVITAVRHYAVGTPLSMPGASALGNQAAVRTPETAASVARLLPPDVWLTAVVAVWSLGVAFLAVRLAVSWRAVRRLRQSAGVPTPVWEARAREVATRLGIRRSIAVVESLWVDVPAVVGWLKPLIIVPTSSMAGLSPAMVDAILTHELAHVRRHDYLVNALQHVTETLLFYHPAVWWTSNRMRVERELCCDEAALTSCGDPVGYARALVTLEELRTSRRAFAVAATDGDLLSRIRNILGQRQTVASPVPALTTIAAIGIVLVMAADGAKAVAAVADAGATLIARVQSTPNAETARAEIGRLEATLRDAIAARDGTALDRLFSSAFVGRTPDDATENKAAAIGRLLTSTFIPASSSLEIRVTDSAVTVSGTEAHVQRREDGQILAAEGRRVTRVWDREADGIWRITSMTTVRSNTTQTEATAAESMPAPRDRSQQLRDIEELMKRLETLNRRSGETVEPPPPPPGQEPPIDESEIVRVGGAVQEPTKIVDVAPVYPQAALDAGVKGIVILEAVINADGTVREARVLRSVPELDTAAVNAVRQWQYSAPGRPLRMTLTVNFMPR